jgi:hypothetical protein
MRLPADAEIGKSVSLTSFSSDVLASVSSRSFTAENCASYLREVNARVEGMDWQDAFQQLKSDIDPVVENLWNIRVTLHDRLPVLAPTCHNEIKRIFVNLRYLEDYLVEVSHNVQSVDLDKIDFQKEKIPMREDSPRYMTFFRNGVSKLDLRAGDIMLTRGVSFLSAMISRLGDPTQFSHVVTVSNDPADGQLKTIESYVGKGVDFYPMDFALKNENARILVLRPREQNIANKSSVQIAKLVRDRLDNKKRIKYDYALDFKDHSTLSCAEVSQYAFELGSDKEMHIPMYQSVLPATDLLKNMGVKDGPTYAPGDLETDPRFELIGEFRDLGITRDGRQKDAVLSSMVNWMVKYHYELRRGFKARMTMPIWLIRRTFLWPMLSNYLHDKFGVPSDLSKEIPLKMMRTMNMMQDIGEVLLNLVKDADSKYQAKVGEPMSFFQIADMLEKFRKDDLALYSNPRTRKQSTLHKKFSADGLTVPCVQAFRGDPDIKSLCE